MTDEDMASAVCHLRGVPRLPLWTLLQVLLRHRHYIFPSGWYEDELMEKFALKTFIKDLHDVQGEPSRLGPGWVDLDLDVPLLLSKCSANYAVKIQTEPPKPSPRRDGSLCR